MDIEDARRIIREENLQKYDLYEDRPNHVDEVVIKYIEKMWIVYTTTERAAIFKPSIREFNLESEALDEFISQLRLQNRIRIWHIEQENTRRT